ncbi:MAG: hemolysin family protein [bacterium]
MDLVLILVLLFLSGFFSGSESALFSIRWWRIDHLRQNGGSAGRLLAELMDHPGSLLMTILIGNTIVNAASSAIFEHWMEQRIPDHALTAAIVIMTIVILIFGEITPKTIALLTPEKIGLFVAHPLKILTWAVWPIRMLIDKTSVKVAQKFRLSNINPIKTDFFALVDEGYQAGVLTQTERQFMTRIMKMNTMTAAEVMVPRMEMVALPDTITFEQAVEAVLKHGYKRIPLYSVSIDNITGIIYALDLLGGKLNPTLKRSPKLLSHSPIFVPSHINLKQLSREFSEKKRHLAIVLDEYGGTAGMVTHDDLLFAIFGSIEPKAGDRWMLKKNDQGGLLVDARIPWPSLCRLIGIRSKNVQFRTLNGFLIDYFGQVPESGQTMIMPEFDQDENRKWKVTIGQTASQRILNVLLDPILPEDSEISTSENAPGKEQGYS